MQNSESDKGEHGAPARAVWKDVVSPKDPAVGLLQLGVDTQILAQELNIQLILELDAPREIRVVRCEMNELPGRVMGFVFSLSPLETYPPPRSSMPGLLRKLPTIPWTIR
jgi:hypothetical protein